ncbi:SHOCT domain-containing protein [Haladaptatus sp. DYF46]|uniref:SHOCT domain-containing protein n=1 Tax=Haladaptatus sp. DYF46 TaxID=2886041 RepID=UPI001E445C0F|nr:SHOCT domain-containing protein [Haladaptatus sp. DYF46]
MGDTPTERFRENATEIASILVTGFWLLALFTGQSWWLPAMLLGYIVVIPIVEMLFGDDEDVEGWWDATWDDDWWDWSSGNERSNEPAETVEPNNRDALETLKNRYARGELTDEQFERKLERLMENDTVEDVEERLRRKERDVERN